VVPSVHDGEVWQNLKGILNRKRVWRGVNKIVRRIEKYRLEGNIVDE
jgi:hypothetical protein